MFATNITGNSPGDVRDLHGSETQKVFNKSKKVFFVRFVQNTKCFVIGIDPAHHIGIIGMIQILKKKHNFLRVPANYSLLRKTQFSSAP